MKTQGDTGVRWADEPEWTVRAQMLVGQKRTPCWCTQHHASTCPHAPTLYSFRTGPRDAGKCTGDEMRVGSAICGCEGGTAPRIAACEIKAGRFVFEQRGWGKSAYGEFQKPLYKTQDHMRRDRTDGDHRGRRLEACDWCSLKNATSFLSPLRTHHIFLSLHSECLVQIVVVEACYCLIWVEWPFPQIVSTLRILIGK